MTTTSSKTVVWRSNDTSGGAKFRTFVLLVGVACYIFGVTTYLTGLSPDEFLFDTALFAAFGAAMVVPLVPILVVGFAFEPLPLGLLVALGTGGVGLGTVGVGLYRRSLPNWSDRYR